MRLFLLTAVCLLCRQFSTAQAQHALIRPDTGDIAVSRIQNLSSIIVKSRRLTAAEILDSVIKYSRRNYGQPPALTGRLTASIISKDNKDTFYYRQVPLILTHSGKKRGGYSMYAAAEGWAGTGSINRMTTDQKLRLAEWTTYPLVSLHDYLHGLRKFTEIGDAYYGISGEVPDLQFHILVRVDELRRSHLAKLQTSAISKDTTMTFLSLVVGRADWSLRESRFMSIGLEQAQAARFRDAGSYTELQELINRYSMRQDARYFENRHWFAARPEGKYVPASFMITDNLLNFSRKPLIKAVNSEGSVYRYSIDMDIPLGHPAPGKLERFYFIDLHY